MPHIITLHYAYITLYWYIIIDTYYYTYIHYMTLPSNISIDGITTHRIITDHHHIIMTSLLQHQWNITHSSRHTHITDTQPLHTHWFFTPFSFIDIAISELHYADDIRCRHWIRYITPIQLHYENTAFFEEPRRTAQQHWPPQPIRQSATGLRIMKGWL